MQRLKGIISALLILSSSYLFAQTDVKNWYLGDPQSDNYYGISINKTYDFLKGKSFTPVIVAVIDSGIDTTHEDLKKILWTNTKEIPGNGIDDDGNGYIDDIHGWNFLGNINGNNLKKANDERTRTYYRYKEKFDGKKIDTSALSAEDKWQYYEWAKAASQMTVDPDEQMEILMLGVIIKSLRKNDEIIKQEMQKEEYTEYDLEKFQPQTDKGKQAKMNYITSFKLLNQDGDVTNKSLLSDLQEYIDGKQESYESKKTAPPDYRAMTIKDNYSEISDKYYGNNDIMGPDPLHGTHVSGIIAAQRDNGIGINGIADHVQIMMIRAIPDGDEYDKDIALAIRYAVDNGAKVINMSFGKSFSPEKNWVDAAIKYAESKDVLLIHAAGNESHDIDSVDNFPNDNLITFHEKADNFISVGASGDPKVGNGEVIAEFSNYGKSSVDVFAPGVKIYSTYPGGNQYGYESGTSMSAPVVTGIAALIRSYYPQLTAEQVKYVIDHSAENLVDTLSVNLPGTDKKTHMDELCNTAGFVNAFRAIELADSLKPDTADTTNKSKQKTTINNSKETKN